MSFLSRHPLGIGKDELPRWLTSTLRSKASEGKKLLYSIRELKKRLEASTSLGNCIKELNNHPIFPSDQKEGEILALLKLLKERKPQFICEIGTGSGGTLLLLTRVCSHDATFLSIDLRQPFFRAMVYSRFGFGRQRVICIKGNSRHLDVLTRVTSVLKNRKLDFLFIDGDHSLDGVRADFFNYSPLVRKGGLVALHDIIPDYHSRYGIETEKSTGDVPDFWVELKSQYKTEQLTESVNQNGYGIGLVHI